MCIYLNTILFKLNLFLISTYKILIYIIFQILSKANNQLCIDFTFTMMCIFLMSEKTLFCVINMIRLS